VARCLDVQNSLANAGMASSPALNAALIDQTGNSLKSPWSPLRFSRVHLEDVGGDAVNDVVRGASRHRRRIHRFFLWRSSTWSSALPRSMVSGLLDK
jgi:hypothetical protein